MFGKQSKKAAELEEKVSQLRERLEKAKKIEANLRQDLERLGQGRRRFLVLTCGPHGLGNRLQNLIYGVAYARATGRLLIPLWLDGVFGPAGHNTFWDVFQETEDVLVRDVAFLAEEQDVTPPVWRGRLSQDTLDTLHARHCTAPEACGLEIHPSCACADWREHKAWQLDLPEKVIVTYGYRHLLKDMPEGLRRREYEGLTDQQVARRLLQAALRPRPEFQAELDRITADLGLDSGRPTLGVHIRNTDMSPNGPLKPIFRKTVEFAEEIAAQTGQRPLIYLATDSETALTMAREAGLDFVTIPKELPPGDQPLHLGNLITDRAALLRTGLLEMYLLSRCRYLCLQGNSTFSTTAALLGPELPDSHTRWHTPAKRSEQRAQAAAEAARELVA
jgi:hypothetical protein